MANKRMGRKYAPRNSSLEVRIAHYSSPQANGCVLWTGPLHSWGYGTLEYKGKGYQAHRVSWALRNGPIPAGLFVCHKCDVPACVNPDHLFLGTHDDNMADKKAKGRAWSHKGEANKRAKLTAAAVLAIRADGRVAREVAADYGISRTLVWGIKHRQTWKHI